MIEIKDATGKVILVYAEKGRDGFRSADLEGANFENAQLESAFFYGARLTNANFRGANLNAAVFYGADLRGACLRGAQLRASNLIAADLTDADLSDADLGPGMLGFATNLQAALLLGCNLSGTILTGAQYDAETRFPPGFDPRLHEMLLLSTVKLDHSAPDPDRR